MPRRTYRATYRRRRPIRRRLTFRRKRLNYRRKTRRTFRSARRLTTTRYRSIQPSDRAYFVAKNEIQYNSKQAALDYGTAITIPGNYLPDANVPGIVAASNNYTKARILRSTITVTFDNMETAKTKTVGITALPIGSTGTVTPSATAYLSEQPHSTSSYLTPLSGSKSTVILRYRGNTKMARGNAVASTSGDDTMNVGSLSTGLLTPPTEAWRWAVWTQNVSGAGTLEASGTNIRVVTRHYIEYFDRQQLQQ